MSKLHKPSRGLGLTHLNCRSLYKKKEELFEALEGADIATFSETWFLSEFEDDLLSWPGMKLFRLDRSKKRGGGVAVYVKKSLTANIVIVDSLCRCNKNVECLVLDVVLPNHKDVVG